MNFIVKYFGNGRRRMKLKVFLETLDAYRVWKTDQKVTKENVASF